MMLRSRGFGPLAAQVVLHEGLLISPHRTSNPEEADFFFVPVYGSCLMERVRHAEAVGLKSIIPVRQRRKRPLPLADSVSLPLHSSRIFAGH